MKKNKLIIIISIIFIIIILLLSIFLMFNKNNKTKDNVDDRDENFIKFVEENVVGFIYMNEIDNVIIENNNKYNISEEVKKTHKYEKFEFENAKIYTDNGMSYFEFDAINLSYVSTTDLPDNIMIGFIKKDGSELYSESYELPKIAVGEIKHEKIEYPYDISNAYDYEFYLF